MAVLILREARISILVEAIASSFGAAVTDRSKDSPRRVVRRENKERDRSSSGIHEFCDTEDSTKPNKQEALISDQELETNRNNLILDRG